MLPFAYTRSADPVAAVAVAGRALAETAAPALPATIPAAPAGVPALAPHQAPVQFLAGGTTQTDLMRLEVHRPGGLIDIADLQIGEIQAGPDALLLPASVRMAEAAEHPRIVAEYPVIAQSLLLAASAQIRQMARLGGNVLQRTRCPYFRDVTWTACNKRKPASGCAAIGGVNRLHAVLGVSDACIASYPGDFAQALIALDARVQILGRDGTRTIAFADLHREPGDRPDLETALAPQEIILGYSVPAAPWTRRSVYRKARDRDSYAFALASAAVALDLAADRTVQEARIALGGVASRPWRSREAEGALTGQSITEASAAQAAEAAFAGAITHEHNAYKVPLGKQVLIQALLDAAEMEI